MPEPMPNLSHVHGKIAFKVSACNRLTTHCHAILKPLVLSLRLIAETRDNMFMHVAAGSVIRCKRSSRVDLFPSSSSDMTCHLSSLPIDM